jgi:hypothetical protein
MKMNKNGENSYLNYRKFIILTCTLLYLLIAPAHCLRVSSVEAGELELMHSYRYTAWIENTENRSYEIILSITPRSKYLSYYVTISPNRLVIGPYERGVINLTLSLPSVMAPGEHTLTILPEVIERGISGTVTLGMSVIEMKFRIPGEIRKELKLSDFNITVEGKEVKFRLIAENTGNVRLGTFPYVEIRRYYGSPATVIRGSTQYLIEPSSSAKMELKHSLQSGTYYATAYLDYGETTNKIAKEFTISEAQTQNGTGTQTGDQEESYLNGSETGIINKTIDITGEEEPEKWSGISISKLEAEPVYIGKPLSIILEIESISPDNLTYQLSIEIFDINGEKLGVISDYGILNSYEVKRMEKEWSSNKPGDYNIKLEVMYGDNLDKKEAKEIWTRVLEKTPTGFAIADPSNMAIVVIVFVLIIILYMKVRR